MMSSLANLDSAEAAGFDARPAIAARKRLAMTLHMRRSDRAGGGRLQPQLRRHPQFASN